MNNRAAFWKNCRQKLQIHSRNCLTWPKCTIYSNMNQLSDLVLQVLNIEKSGFNEHINDRVCFQNTSKYEITILELLYQLTYAIKVVIFNKLLDIARKTN